MHVKVFERQQILIWVTAFILANLRGMVFWDFLVQGFQWTGLSWIELLIWSALFLLVLQILNRDCLLAGYIQLWKKNLILVLFIFIALLSLLWTVSLSATLYRGGALLFSSLIGAYIAVRYSLKEFLNMLYRFGTVQLIVCLALALFLPIFGTMGWEPYNGAWRGLFWHKNQLGSLTVIFSLVFLVSALDKSGRTDENPIAYFIFYILSLIVIYFSKSVAGYFLFLVVSLCTLAVFVWLKIRYRLRALHYYGVLVLALAVLVILPFNLDTVFGLFNRDTSLTGRVPLWTYLVDEAVRKAPWLGYGFGAIWSISSFRVTVQHALGWPFPVAIGDNGFLDILLHVGFVGLILFLMVLFISFMRSSRYAFSRSVLSAFFPLLFMIYAVIANISFSLFLETETFVWLLMVTSLFIVTKEQSSI